LQVSLGLAPNPCFPRIIAKEFAVDEKIRKELVISLGSSQFESFLSQIIPSQIPTAHVEGYSDIRERALKACPKQPKLIYTPNALYGDEGFKVWTAEKSENQTKVVTAQHGAHYGSSLWSTTEEHEIKISDKYFTWGWADGTKSKEISVPAAQLLGVKHQIKANPRGDILWSFTSVPRYSYWLCSFPLGPHFIHYLADQELFARAVSPEVQKLLTLRLDPNVYGWGEEERWFDINPSLKTYRGRKTFFQQLSESRLSISTYNSTTLLETLVANFPTIIFWNPEYFELRSSAERYYNDLRKAGILHDTPESAAAKVSEIYEDPMSWWMSTEVQTIKNEFCQRYARTSDDYLTKWKEELLKVATEAGV
jgi:putative transferase (TIGR04331 family)